MLKIDAIVLVGISKRLENKHMMKLGSVSLIEYVIQNIKSFNIFDTIYLSTIRNIHVPGAVTVIDNIGTGPLSGIYSAMNRIDNPAFVFGGDMPFIKKEAVEFMISKFEGKSVIPRWYNGYIEPLHSLYFISDFPDIELSSALHELVARIDKEYVSAEHFDAITFYNINTASDMELAVQIYKTLK
ncbi:MAG: molybdenum cofactor guanylyltransferase [Thermoplasmata archaeon]